MARRQGVTLLEVLVSIFIMGIGMIALLTLFPLGALSMAQAIRDGRVNDAAAEAAALANTFGVRNDNVSVPTPPYYTTTPPYFTVANVFSNYLAVGPVTNAPAADPAGPGYPVYVDPYYVALGQTTLGSFGSSPYNGTGSTPGFVRCSTTYVGSSGQSYTFPTTPTATVLSALASPPPPASETPPSTVNWAARYFTLKDDINFQNSGTALGYVTGTPTSVQRGGSYTWAYLLRRLRAGSGAEVELFVVVYAGRSVQIAAGETACPVTSTTSSGNAALGDNAVSLTVPVGTAPQLRRGAWLLDTSFEQITSGSNTYGTVHGQFYRVADVSGSGPYLVELDQPLKNNNVNVMVVMDNVVEVVYKGTGWQP
jgi:prepilin-type N-terminal cleavage/methylation domain-containing protein